MKIVSVWEVWIFRWLKYLTCILIEFYESVLFDRLILYYGRGVLALGGNRSGNILH